MRHSIYRKSILLPCLFFCLSIVGVGHILAAKEKHHKKSVYQLVFSDEFDRPDGQRPNPLYWSTSRRGTSTWNRWVSDVEDVAFVSKGKLILRAIPNTTRATSDTATMQTGAVETMHKFSFCGGKVEVRLRTNKHRGNFPAVWLMPEPPSRPHPDCGEIDIFECIDKMPFSVHTVHSAWTMSNLKRRCSFRRRVNVGRWHVYGLEWNEKELVWTVDGKRVGAYQKSDNPQELAAGQWPFDERPFYLILNQSVGNGSWAMPADTAHVYETQIDWVRVYQRTENDKE